MFRYDVYGARLGSIQPLPELTPARETRAGAMIEVAFLNDAAVPLACDGKAYGADGDRIHFRFPHIAAFLVDGQHRIVVSALQGADDRQVRRFLLAPVLPALLHQRGQLVLHANSVSIGGRAVVIAGGTGAGKSTITAALVARGHELLSDDVTVVDIAEHGISVQPGFPQMKLWPDTANLLCSDVEALPRVDPLFDKRTISVWDRFSSDARPLERIFILCDDSADGIAAFSPRDAFKALVQHSYCAGLVPLTDPVRHFRQCAALATQVGIKHFPVRRSLADLPEVAGLVEDDLACQRDQQRIGGYLR